MNKRTAIILALAAKPENHLSEGGVNWDFVSSDLHIEHPEIVEGVSYEEEDSWYEEIAEARSAAYMDSLRGVYYPKNKGRDYDRFA